MRELLALTLTKIEIKSEATRGLRDQLLELKDDFNKAERLLAEMLSDKKRNDCSKCDSRHFCSLFLSCIYHELGDTENMQKEIRAAIKDFYRVGSKWNEMFARWIYGTLLLEVGDTLPARRELERTIEILEEMAKKFRKEDKYEKRDECYRYAEEIRGNLP